MAVPKRKTSKSKTRIRKRTVRGEMPDTKPCPSCGAPQLSHRACTACGMYRGRQVLTVKSED